MMATVLWMSALRNDGLQQKETRKRRRRNVKAYLWAFAIQAVSIAQKNKRTVDVLD
jgi:hypothetical protein